MTTPTCRTQRDLMVEHILGELDGLVATRLEAHLDACAECQQVYERLQVGFTSAKTFEPEVDDEDLERWSGRLEPFLVETPRPARFAAPGFWGWAVGGAAAAAGVLAVLTLGGGESAPGPRPEVSPPGLVAASSGRTLVVDEPPSVDPVPVRNKAFTKQLRAVTSEDFDGEVSEPKPGLTELEVRSGFAVLDFERAEKTRLRVVAEGVDIRVLGTRFFVEARPGVPTSVGVVSGRIEVRSQGRVEILGAGQVRAYDETGAYTPDRDNLRSVEHHGDAFLDGDGARHAVAPKTKSAPKGADPVVALTRAEQLVRTGRVEEGLRLYDEILAGVPPETIAYMVRYERARVWGFVQGDRARAEAAFAALEAASKGEVRRQAALARCELAVRNEPCDARRCLLDLEAQGRYSEEVQALLRAWGVSGNTSCDHKNGAPPRPTK